jgi:SAM-dependent methyltransferase
VTSVEQLWKFYLCDEDLSLFDIWEGGAANGDSVTPSTYSAPYRAWMIDFLTGLLDRTNPPTLLSVGCGNASVEAEVARAGYDVLAVDLLERAVQIARRKGLTAEVADIRSWSPEEGRWGVVYADGLMAHLYDPDDSLVPILKHLHGWLAQSGSGRGATTSDWAGIRGQSERSEPASRAPGPGVLVISNDGTQQGQDAQQAPGIPAHWLSAGYLVEQCREAGFGDVSYTTFTYTRPLSGPRDRVVVTAYT